MKISVPVYINEQIRDRLQKVIEVVVPNLPEVPVEVFVCMDTREGRTNWPAVWLFTANLVAEIRNPLDRDRIQHDIAPFTDAVDWLRLTGRKYEFKESKEESELVLEFSTVDSLSGTLSAVGPACDHLMEIYHGQFLKNFVGISPLRIGGNGSSSSESST